MTSLEDMIYYTGNLCRKSMQKIGKACRKLKLKGDGK